MRVLLVEDEKKLAQALQHIGKKEKINMDICHDGNEGFYMAESVTYDVIILDIMLPNMTGLEILKNLRYNKNQTPILLLTARDRVSDKVDGLECGADDYLTKPFATEELFARIKALSRRIDTHYQDECLEFSNIRLNLKSQILYIDEEEIPLKNKEFELLEMLMKRPRQIFTRDQILDKVWGYNNYVTMNNIEICVHNLRKKLKSGAKSIIETVRGIGYQLKEL